jgi:rubrerythrin/protein-tyrosine-phosphatase
MEPLLQSQEFILKPITIKNVLLLSPGKWNDVDYTELEIQKAYENTDWNDRKFTSLYLDHQDTKERGVGNWVGYIKNKMLRAFSLYGDLEIWNPMIGAYLSQAKAKFGVSATLAGRENKQLGRMEDFHFESFSIVTDPACKPAMINLSDKQVNMVADSDVQIVTMENETKEDIIELESVKHRERRENIESVNDTKDFASALKSAMADEAKAPGDYENLKSLIDNEECKAKIDGIIADEKRHYAILEIMEIKHELANEGSVAPIHTLEPVEIEKKKKKENSEINPSLAAIVLTEKLDSDAVRKESSDIQTLKGGIKMPEILENNKVVELAAIKVVDAVPVVDSPGIHNMNVDGHSIFIKQEGKNLSDAKPEDKKAEKADEDEDEKDKKDKDKDKDEKEMSSETILKQIKEMSAEELVSYTNFVKSYLSENNAASAKEVTLAYEKSKADKKSEKELSASDLLAAMDSRIASLKELDSSKKMSEMETKIQELSAKVKMPDRKTLSVAFDSEQNSNIGMLSFLQHRIN